MSINAAKKGKDIAIFGGTFDPIHLGHTENAKHIATWLNLEKIILLPAHIPPHKEMPITDTQHRIAMVDLVCQQSPLFALDTREISRNTPSYTVETLAEFRQENPNSRLFFIVGMDSLLTFTHWYKWQEILSLCHIIVCTRPGYSNDNFPEATKSLLSQYQATPNHIKDKLFGHILLSPAHNIDISSTQLRIALQAKQGIGTPSPSASNEKFSKYIEMLSPTVQQYINKHRLYQ